VISVVHHRTFASVYLDGGLAMTDDMDPPVSGSSDDLIDGGYPSCSSSLDGLVGEIIVYARAMNPSSTIPSSPT
jgi:hypothetical protein